jgi:VWFA-related protein
MAMTTTTTVKVLSMVAAAFLVQAPPSFRSGADAKTVDVSVFDRGRVVTNLGVADFELYDNQVRQTIDTVDLNTLPIDLRLAFDTSDSISEEDLARYVRTMDQVTATLEPRDRAEIITFNSLIADAASRQHPPVKVNFKRSAAEGTSFFDAVTLALVTVKTAERRQITIILSDAMDNTSFFDERTMEMAAKNTDAVVYTILPGNPANNRAVSKVRLRMLSLLTGGDLMETHESHVGSAVINAIKEFRQSYKLNYHLTGVPIAGWHKLEVRVRGGYRVRMREGYFSK